MIQQKFNFTMDSNKDEEGQRVIEAVVSNKDVLLGVFELMFGVGGYAGQGLQNLEHQIKQKKYSLINPDLNNSQPNDVNITNSFFTEGGHNNSQTSNHVQEYDRLFQIMNAPIESLIHISKSQSKLRVSAHGGARRPMTVRPDKRAQTAIGKPPIMINKSL